MKTSESKILSLTKEGFWNELMEKYPSEMNDFCWWIDEYKKRVDWNKLFHNEKKYHDLPIAMQVGIFIQFTLETHYNSPFMEFLEVSKMDDFVDEVKDWFFNEHDLNKLRHK